MKKSRREFLKLSGLAGIGIASTGMIRSKASNSIVNDDIKLFEKNDPGI